MKTSKWLLTTVLTASATVAVAQPPGAPPAPPVPPAEGEAVASNGRNPAISYLMNRYRLDEAEATKRIELQKDIMELSERINRSNDKAFASIFIQHEPVYKVVISFADKDDRQALLASIPPRLRQFVQLRVAKRSRDERLAGIKQLRTALAAPKVRFIIGYDSRNDQYRVEVASQADRDALNGLVPEALRDQVRFEVKKLPEPQTAPLGVQAGDRAQAGYRMYQRQDAAATKCTIAYPVRYGQNRTLGILTAGHCVLPYYFYYAGHWITFPTGALYRSQNASYDFQVLEITGIGTNNMMYYDNSVNRIPEFATSGWLNTIGTIPWSNQWNGDVMCKSGAVSGLTCGEIIDDSYDYGGGGLLWIKVSHTQQFDLSKPGDSGAPWFMYPGASSDVIASGIHTAGPLNDSGYSSEAVYMPIDRVDDYVPVELILTSAVQTQ